MGDVKTTIGLFLVLAIGVLLFSGVDGTLLAALEGQEGSDAAPLERPSGSSPDDLVAFDENGWGVRGPVAVAAGPTHHWIDDTLIGYAPKPHTNEFVMGDLIATTEDCAVRGYDGVSPVFTVLAGRSGRPLGVSADSVPQLDYEVGRLTDIYARGGTRSRPLEAGTPLEVVDVVVPATQTPIHLALLPVADELVWSFHFEEGAELAGVTIIGSNSGGVLNLPLAVPVEAIARRQMEACYRPVMVQEYFEVTGSPRSPDRAPNSVAQLEAALAGARRNSSHYRKLQFELWFIEQFGQNPRAAISGYPSVQVAVAGQAPVAPVSWRAEHGGTLRLINGVIYLVGDEQTRTSAWDGLVRQTAAERAGMPLEQLSSGG